MYTALQSKSPGNYFNMFVRCARVNIKVIILALSFIVFIYLTSKTLSSNLLAYNGGKYKFEKVKNHYDDTNYILVTNRTYVDEYLSDYRVIWDSETVQLYRKQLGICPDANADEQTEYDDDDDTDTDLEMNLDCFHTKPKSPEQCQNKIILTALPGDDNDIETAMWELLSLSAIENSFNSTTPELLFYLSNNSYILAQSVLDEVSIPSIRTADLACLELTRAEIIGDRTNVSTKFDKLEDHKTIMLEQYAIRYMEIRKLASQGLLLSTLTLSPELTTAVNDVLIEVRKENGLDQLDVVNFVGLYIKDKDKLPFAYYIRAIKFHVKQHKSPVFIIICGPDKMKKCEQEFRGKNKLPDSVQLYLTETMYPEFEFGLMALCNHTIASNSQGALTGLMNGGVTVVFGEKTDNYKYIQLPWLLSTEISNWYSIK